jgi:hypothetical protein
VNRDQQNAYRAKIAFERYTGEPGFSFDGPIEISIFGKDQYHWHPGHTRPVGHAEYPMEPSVVSETAGMADPDGPILHIQQTVDATTSYELPAASVIVIHGNIRDR